MLQRGLSREYSVDSYAGITRIRFEGPKRYNLISADFGQHPLCSHTTCIIVIYFRLVKLKVLIQKLSNQMWQQNDWK